MRRRSGPGGWAALLCYGQHERELAGGEPSTTNNRMELMAAIRALEALTRPCKVRLFADSNYVVKGMSEWIEGWKRKGWKKVKNRDLWERRQAGKLSTLEMRDTLVEYYVAQGKRELDERFFATQPAIPSKDAGR